jgi:hypothetical protein
LTWIVVLGCGGCAQILGIGQWVNLTDAGSSGPDSSVGEQIDATSDSPASPDAHGAGNDAHTGTDVSPGPDAGPDVDAAPDVEAGGGFTPTAGVTPTDLDGTGLVSLTVTPGDAGSGDAGGSTDTIVNVDTGEITAGSVVIRPATTGDPSVRDVQAGIAYRQTADNLAIFSFGALTVAPSATLTLKGVRAVALAAAGTINIEGSVEVRPWDPDGGLCAAGVGAPGGYAGGGEQTVPANPLTGPTGSTGTPGGGPGGGGAGIFGSGAGCGGGGGGHAGTGGNVCLDGGAPCADGGAAYGSPTLDVVSFHGGAGGGGGGISGSTLHGSVSGGPGGAGGGALRLVAGVAISVGVSAPAAINAGGCGGFPPFCASEAIECMGVSRGGGGGGAGGFILFETPRLELGSSALIVASGGGGSSSGVGATPDSGTALGCLGDLNHPGGAGGTGTPDPNGRSNPDLTVNLPSFAGPACGGGGATGYIVIHSQNPAIATGAQLFPAPTSSAYAVIALTQ